MRINTPLKIFILFVLLPSRLCFSQPTSLSGVINSYAKVTAVFQSESIKIDSVKVDDASAFKVGDKALLIQMKGAEINSAGTSISQIHNTGKYEILVVSNSDTISDLIIFTAPLFNVYDPNESVQLVRVPHYLTASVDSVVTCLPWNGTIGGIVALIADNAIHLKANIDVSGKGFRGSQPSNVVFNGVCSNDTGGATKKYYTATAVDSAGLKGEGAISNSFIYARGYGSAVNGGGGGVGKNGGGYGGGNIGSGGEGGKEISNCATPTIEVSTADISKTYINNIGSHKNRIFLGGGGGSGTQQVLGGATKGGDGGGIILLLTDTIYGNGKSLVANGADVADVANNGGAGGGGGGGMIVLSVSHYSQTQIYANGGKGGYTDDDSCSGPGGGGGGGFLWLFGNGINDSIKFSYWLNGGKQGYPRYNCSGQVAFSGSDGRTDSNLIMPLNGFLFNVTSGDHTVCQNQIPDTLYGSKPRGGDGTYVYTWQRKTKFTGWQPATEGTSNQQLFAFNNTINDTSEYRRIVSSAGITDTSGIVSVRVIPKILNNIIANHQTICSGSTPDSITGTTPTGGGHPSPNYSYTWQLSNNNSSWSNAMPVNNVKNYIPNMLFDTTYYRRVVNTNICYDTSLSVKITVLPIISNNAFSSSAYACKQDPSDSLKGAIPQGGDNNYRYLWQSSLNNNNWINAKGDSLNRNYVAGVLSDTLYFRRIVNSGLDDCCKDTSTSWKVNLLNRIESNTISSEISKVCKNTKPTKAIDGNLPLGATGVYEYLWKSSVDNINWQDITASDTSDLTADLISQKTYFKRIVQSEACKDTSNIVMIDIHNLPIGNLISINDTICSNDSIALKFIIAGDNPPYSVRLKDSSNLVSTLLNVRSNISQTTTLSYVDSVKIFALSISEITDSLGCVSQSTGVSGIANITVFGIPIAKAGDDREICDSTTTLNAVKSFGKGYWEKLSGTGKVSLDDSVSSKTKMRVDSFNINSYQLVWTEDNNGCKATDTVQLTFYTAPKINAGTDITLLFRTDTILSASPLQAKETGEWSFIVGSGVFDDKSMPTANVNSLKVNETNILQWAVTKGVCVQVADSLNIIVKDIVIPTGFSPNNDGINDILEIPGIENTKSCELIVFNRWGKIVYLSGEYKNNWTGKNQQGDDLPEGTYYYVLKVIGELTTEKNGFFIIKR